MSFVHISKDDSVAVVTLNRGKVNALNEPLIEELNRCFVDLENDKIVKSVIFTGREFVDIWYSEETWKKLKEIKIYS